MAGDTGEFGEPPWGGPAPQWPPEERLTHRYNELVWRLMADYKPSYDPGQAENEWRMAPGGENDPYGGPFYTTAIEAQEAAAHHRQQADAAAADLPAAEASLREQTGYVEKLRAELAGSRPWQRHRREQLRGQIAVAEDVLFDRYNDASVLEFLVKWSPERHSAAAWIAGVLGRHERARDAAQDAAARAMGWRPGQPVPGSTSHNQHALEAGRQASTTPGNRTTRVRLPRAATDPSSAIAPVPPAIQPPHGPTAHM
ncbi:MAG TPA: hypothetical protein VGH27_09785 [Streptosporangiaceae bacterium]|jgi:hypothetical protein